MDLLTLTDADIAHRTAFMEYCVTSADPHYQSMLQVLYEQFQVWQDAFFGGQLVPPHFLILAPRIPNAEGDYTPISGWGSKSQIRLRPTLFDATHPHLAPGNGDPEGIQRYWLDVALHECVHQYCHEVLGKPEYAEKGHGLIFARECSRIGALMGLPPVGPARKSRNRAGLPSCAFWPTCVRPADYYLGAYRPDLALGRASQARAATGEEVVAAGEDTVATGAIDSVAAAAETDGDIDRTATPAGIENPLRPEEWQLLLQSVHDRTAHELLTRLAAHHGVPLPTAAEALITSQPLPAVLPTGPEATPSIDEDAAILARLPDGFHPSHYQMDLFRFVATGQGDGLVSAVAGSGKTTSLVMAARLTEGAGLFLAFNRHIAEELREKLAGTRMVARTIHSVGYTTLVERIGKVRIDERKYAKIAKEAVRQSKIALGEPQQKAIEALQLLANLSRLTLTDPTDPQALTELIEHFTIEIDPATKPTVLALLPQVLNEGERLAKQQQLIDYTDQLWLCYRWQLQPRRLPNVFVDECQDLNAAQLDLVLKCRAPGGGMLFVGDPRQAIMAFAGADAQSFWNIQRRTQATILPLSVCYRCPTSHLDMARRIVPEIESAPGALEGEIATITEDQLGAWVQRGDMIICRLTAPLVKICIQLIERRMSARVRGRDIGKQLTTLVRAAMETPGYTWERFATILEDNAQRHIVKLARREGTENQIQSLRDRVDAVQVCYTACGAASAEQLIAEIDQLFSDEQPDVLLSTVHRAKGLENDRIFVLYPEKLPLVWGDQQPWEYEQEQNLRYVALTRAKKSMVFIQEPLRRTASRAISSV